MSSFWEGILSSSISFAIIGFVCKAFLQHIDNQLFFYTFSAVYSVCIASVSRVLKFQITVSGSTLLRRIRDMPQSS